MTSVSHVTAMYATKRRRRNSKNSVRTVCSKDSHSKSNPSKRHRERLNQELDTLASLLPFEQSVLSKLDKLSILRLSVSYLRTKSYFQAALSSGRLLGHHQSNHHKLYNSNSHQFVGTGSQQQQALEHQPPTSSSLYPPELRIEGDLIVQALNGFLLILTCDGEVFYTSHTVETYLGFHQSDICHQSVYELVHSEDREELMQQLKWNSKIPQAPLSNGAATNSNNNNSDANHQSSSSELLTAKSPAQMSLQEILASTDHRHLLERNFTVRFRCLLDNTSGFLRLDIRGRIKVLHGQQNPQNLANSAANGSGATNNGSAGSKQAKFEPGSQQQSGGFSTNNELGGQREPMLAFFGVCIPFGPPSLLEMPAKDSVFKSKHRLDMSLISMDSRGRQLLGLTDLSGPIVRAQRQASGGSSSPKTLASGQESQVSAKLEPVAGKTAAASCATNSSTGSQQQVAAGSNSTNRLQQSISAYDLVHHDDLSYMASAHQELLKTGASGLIAYRMITQQPEGSSSTNETASGGGGASGTGSGQSSGGSGVQWLQTSAKLYYKNSKPDFILCTHRPLMEEEGRDLLGKRTMDFKVTYLDAGLSSINDRIMACDKFSSLQALGNSNNNSSHRADKSPAGNATVASPVSTGDTNSTRSLASLSPQSTLTNTDEHLGSRLKPAVSSNNNKRKLNNSYDLNSQQQYDGTTNDYNQHELIAQQSIYDGHPYKRSQNGDIFYDMDSAADGCDQSGNRKSAVTATPTKKKASAKGNCKQTNAGSKRREAEAGDKKQLAGYKGDSGQYMAADYGSQQQQVNGQQPQQQMQMYSQYHQQQQQYHSHQPEIADPAAAYPAIQAAAVYAASLGHHHHTHHHHQGVYGSSGYAASHQSAAQSQHHQSQASGQAAAAAATGSGASNSSAQSAALYGASSAASYMQQHHSQLHHGAHQLHGYRHHQAPVGAAGHYGSAYASGSFLPTEHLLHHYSQTAAARSAAALVAWPTSGSDYTTAAAASAAVAASYGGNEQQPAKPSRDSYSPQATGGAGSADYQSQYQQSHQQPQQPESLSSAPSPASISAGQKVAQRYANLMSSPTTASGQQSSQLQVHGPGSLTSDGSTHRSPLSSGESSNGSGSLVAAAQAVAAVAAAASAGADTSAMISPSAYYLAAADQSQQQQPSSVYHNQHQQQQHQQQQQQHQHQQSYATYHQSSPYRAHHQYGTDTAAGSYTSQHYGQAHGQHHSNLSHHHNHHHLSHHLSHQQQQQQQQQQQETATAAAVAASSYFQHAASGDLAAAVTGSHHHHHHHVNHSSSALAAVKLYGANGDQTSSSATMWTPKTSDQQLQQPVGRTDESQQISAEEPEVRLAEENSEENQGGQTNDDGPRGDAEAIQEENGRDPLAQLISSTIGDQMLDQNSNPKHQLNDFIKL